MSNDANGFVIADAIRVEKIGDPPPPTPEIAVSLGGADIADDTQAASAVSFGETEPNVALTKTFTVTNVGTQALSLVDSISVTGTSYTLVSGFGTTSLAAGASATFDVELNSATKDVYAGNITFDNGDADENPFNFAITGEVKEIPVLEFLDDGDSGYTSNGFVAFSKSGYFGSDGQYASPGSGASKATWVASELPAGTYRISVTWSAGSNRASNTPYTINGGDAIRVNQKLSPGHSSFTSLTDTESGLSFAELSDSITLGNTGSITVQMTNDANGFVIADAIRIEKIG